MRELTLNRILNLISCFVFCFRSYEDQLADHYGTLPPSGSLSSLGPAPLTVAPSGPWRQPDLPEVLAMLSYTLDAVRLNAAAYLQHLSYRNEDVKKEVCGWLMLGIDS